MRRGAWGIAVVGLLLGALALSPAQAAPLMDPTTVNANSDPVLAVLPGDTSTVSDVSVIVPAGFRVGACPSTTFACSKSAHNASQETSVFWTRSGGSGAARQPDDRFEFEVRTPSTGGNYTFTIAVNDTAKGGRSEEVVVAVKGGVAATTTTTAATAAVTTTTAVKAATSSTTTTSTTAVPSTTDSTSEVIVERSSESTTTTTTADDAPVAIAPVDDDDDDAASPAIAGLGVVAILIALALVLQRVRRDKLTA